VHIENHPFPEFISTGATALIVGSFPPIKLTVKNPEMISGNNKNLYEDYFSNAITDKDRAFYYGSRNNLFWKIIEDHLSQPIKQHTDQNCAAETAGF